MVILLSGGVFAQSADHVIEQYEIMSHGSDRAALQNITYKGKLLFVGQEMPFTLYAKRKNAQFSYSPMKKQTIKMVHTPLHSWLTDSQVGQTTIQHFPVNYFPLIYWNLDLATTLYQANAKGYKIFYEGKEASPWGERYILSVSNLEERSIVYYLSPKTYLPSEIVVMTKFKDDFAKETYHLSDYKKVQGMPIAMHWETRTDQGRPHMIFQIEEVLLDQKLPKGIFQLPGGDLTGPNLPGSAAKSRK